MDRYKEVIQRKGDIIITIKPRKLFLDNQKKVKCIAARAFSSRSERIMLKSDCRSSREIFVS